MTTFYRTPAARITDRTFEIRCPAHSRFAIHDLEHVHVREVIGRFGPGPVCSSGLLGAAAAAAAGGWPLGGQELVFVALAGGLALAASVAKPHSWRGRISVFELAAMHKGRWITLYRCTDPVVFTRVQRALFQALASRDR